MIYNFKKYKNIFFLIAVILNIASINYTEAAIIPESDSLSNQLVTSSFMLSGKASWYSYKNGLFAASPDFIAGTKLKVTSVNNPNKIVVVTVNDYGPDRKIYPDRVIDLDKVAFAQLAPLGAGIIDVVVEPVISDVLKSEGGPVEAVIDPMAATTSQLSSPGENLSRAAVSAGSTLLNYNIGELWQNNKTGGVYWVTSAGKQPLVDRVFLQTIFKGKKINQKTPAVLEKLKTLSPVVFSDGFLLKTPKSSAVYLIYHNEKRAFLNGDVFEKLNYAWDNILIVPDKLIGQYKTGLLLDSSNIKTKEVTEEIITTSKSVVILNAINGQIIYSKNATEQLPLASLSKLVAIKIFLDTKPDLNKVVTYKVQDENYNYQYADKSVLAKLGVSDGETMTIRDLLYSSVLGSANNAIESLVRVSGLSRQDFIIKMNEYVKSIGTTETKFIEPTGLSPENVSSAFDYGLIARSVLADSNLEKVSMTKDYSFTTINTKKYHYIKNSNILFFTSDLQITGSKTGYLDEAQYCLMTRAKDSNGHEVIVVTLGAPSKASSFAEMKNFISYGLELGL